MSSIFQSASIVSSAFDLISFSTLRQEAKSECVDGCLSKWKIIFAAVLLLEGLMFGQVVFLLKKFAVNPSNSGSSSKFRLTAHFGNALSAGAFFATGMLHILPEAIEFFRVMIPTAPSHQRRPEAMKKALNTTTARRIMKSTKSTVCHFRSCIWS